MRTSTILASVCAILAAASSLAQEAATEKNVININRMCAGKPEGSIDGGHPERKTVFLMEVLTLAEEYEIVFIAKAAKFC